MIRGLRHATFLCCDLARARAFYEGVLGLAVDSSRPPMGFEGVWYELGEHQQIHLMCLPNPGASLPRPEYGGRDRHVAFGVIDLAQLRSRLEASGIAYTESHSGRVALFCRDPDQNALEFIEVHD